MVTVKKPRKREKGWSTKMIVGVISIGFFIMFFSTSTPNTSSSSSSSSVNSLKDTLENSKQGLSAPVLPHPPNPLDSNSNMIIQQSHVQVRPVQKQQQQMMGGGLGNMMMTMMQSKIQKITPKNTAPKKTPRGASSSTDYFFTNDFDYERQNPLFRHQSVPDWDVDHVTSLVKKEASSLRSCRYKSDDHSLLYHSHCDAKTKLIAYNAASFSRTWCGTTIPPHKAVIISVQQESKCHLQPVTIFPQQDLPSENIASSSVPPIVITSTPDATDPKTVKVPDCDVPCETEEKFPSHERFIQDTGWKIHFTMDDPARHDYARVEPTAYRNDVYYATTSFKSSVPQSFFSFDEYDIFAPALTYDRSAVDANGGSYLVNSMCVSRFTKRNRWSDAVKRQITVHFYGGCAHDSDTKGLGLRKKQDRLALLRQHLFTLALEFGDVKDHITPLVWEAMSSGTLPVIIGASNLGSHLPPHSYVSNAGLQHWDDLGHLVKSIVQNQTLWESYHTYRKSAEEKRAFEERYAFTKTSATCRLCRWAYAKKYGLGWNQVQQTIRPPHLNRQVLLTKSKQGRALVVGPFQESWLYSSSSDNKQEEVIDEVENGENEHSNPLEGTISSVSIPQVVDRIIHVHDHILDIEFQNLVTNDNHPNKDLILRLSFSQLKNFNGAHFPHAHSVVPHLQRGAVVSSLALQDGQSKITLVANWHTTITCQQEGTVDLVVRSAGETLPHGTDERRRLRIIMEDMVELYDKVTEYFPTTFAQQMIQDFVDPMELYYLEEEGEES